MNIPESQYCGNMQAITQTILRHSAFNHSRTLAVCTYHSKLQRHMKRTPINHTNTKSYSIHCNQYHRQYSSNSVWNRNLNRNIVRTGGLLAVGQDPIGIRTKFDVDINTEFKGDTYFPTPAEFAYEYLEYFNESYPWWLTIITIAVGVRSFVVFPFSVYQHTVMARLENCQTDINTKAEQLKQKVISAAKLQKWSQQQVEDTYGKELRYMISDVHFDNKCGIWRPSLVVGAQMLMWSAFTVGLGQMSGKYPELFMAEPDIDFLPELCTQGALWFTDLTQPSIAIAITYGLVNLALTELWSVRRGPLQKSQEIGVHAFRGISVGMAGVAAFMPAAVSLYWLTSSTAGLFYFILLRINPIRRLFDIEETPSEMKNPFQDTKKALKAKYSKNKGNKYVA